MTINKHAILAQGRQALASGVSGGPLRGTPRYPHPVLSPVACDLVILESVAYSGFGGGEAAKSNARRL